MSMLVINLNEAYIDCRVCGAAYPCRYGIPMYEDLVLHNDYEGEWAGQPACRTSYEAQCKLSKPMWMGLFRVLVSEPYIDPTFGASRESVSVYRDT